MQKSQHNFYQDYGYALACDLYSPESEPRFGVVFCQGFGGTKEYIAPDLANLIVDRFTCAFLAFDYSGWGDSEGPRGRLNPFREVDETRNAVTFLLAKFPALRGHIGLYGTSFGGPISIVAAADEERAGALVAMSSFADGDRWMRDLRPHWQWMEFCEAIETDRAHRAATGKSKTVEPSWILPRDPSAEAFNRKLLEEYPSRRFELDVYTAELICTFKVLQAAQRLKNKPSFFIHSKADALIPYDHSVLLAAEAGAPLLSLETVTHHGLYSGEAIRTVAAAAGEFFERHLVQS